MEVLNEGGEGVIVFATLPDHVHFFRKNNFQGTPVDFKKTLVWSHIIFYS